MTHRVPTSVVREEDVRAHASTIEARYLLVAAVHVTHDLSLLDRFAPRLPAAEVGLARAMAPSNPAADPPGLRDELLDILCTALTREQQPAYLHPDTPELFARLAEVVLGSPADETEVLMCMEHSGFVPDRRMVEATRRPP